MAPTLSSTNRPPATGERFLLVDGLRGLACLAVVLHHAVHSHVLTGVIRSVLPQPLDVASMWGALGVQIFFVISGFVIAHSVRNLPLDAKGIGNFALRRQIRLDPPYWTVLAITLVYGVLESLLPGTHPDAVPNGLGVAANAFYLHKILNSPQIVGVAWTLCIEVQFYLAFIALLWCTRSRPAIAAPTLALSAAACAVAKSLMVPLGDRIFLAFWFFFALGALAYWVARGLAKPFWLGLLLLAVAASDFQAGLETNSGKAVWTALAVTLLLLGAASAGTLGRWSGGPFLQYLGRISYSLYLVHLLTIKAIAAIGYKLTHSNTVAGFGWVLLSLCLSGVAAHLLHQFVERPSMNLASKLKLAKSLGHEARTDSSLPLETQPAAASY